MGSVSCLPASPSGVDTRSGLWRGCPCQLSTSSGRRLSRVRPPCPGLCPLPTGPHPMPGQHGGIKGQAWSISLISRGSIVHTWELCSDPMAGGPEDAHSSTGRGSAAGAGCRTSSPPLRPCDLSFSTVREFISSKKRMTTGFYGKRRWQNLTADASGLEPAHDTCSGELDTFQRTAPGVLLDAARGGVPLHEARAACRNMGYIRPTKG